MISVQGLSLKAVCGMNITQEEKTYTTPLPTTNIQALNERTIE